MSKPQSCSTELQASEGDSIPWAECSAGKSADLLEERLSRGPDQVGGGQGKSLEGHDNQMTSAKIK